jgi:hypothetical protein
MLMSVALPRCVSVRELAGARMFWVSEDHVRIMQVAYLRAALMEYVAIEEVLSTDLVTRGLGEEPFRILDTGNAMLILLRELRHLQLHLVNTILEGTRKSAVPRTKNRDKEIETELTVLTISRADLCQLKSLRNAARFDTDDLDAAISWFSRAQAQWGIGDAILAGIQVYASELVRRYSLVPL